MRRASSADIARRVLDATFEGVVCLALLAMYRCVMWMEARVAVAVVLVGVRVGGLVFGAGVLELLFLCELFDLDSEDLCLEGWLTACWSLVEEAWWRGLLLLLGLVRSVESASGSEMKIVSGFCGLKGCLSLSLLLRRNDS